MSVPNTPIVNLGNKYVNGCALSYVGNTSITMASGQVRDSSDVNDIVIPSLCTVNAALNGVVNGLDTGSLAASTLYAVYAIADSTAFRPAGCLLSLSFSQPTLPFGYDMYRRVGAVKTDGSSHLLDFTQNGRYMYYAAAIATAITAGAATSFTAIDLSADVPSVSGGIITILKAVLTADAGATRTVALRATGSSSAAGQVIASSPASTVTTASLVAPSNSVASVDYLVSNASAAVAISVFGYIDQL